MCLLHSTRRGVPSSGDSACSMHSSKLQSLLAGRKVSPGLGRPEEPTLETALQGCAKRAVPCTLAALPVPFHTSERCPKHTCRPDFTIKAAPAFAGDSARMVVDLRAAAGPAATQALQQSGTAYMQPAAPSKEPPLPPSPFACSGVAADEPQAAAQPPPLREYRSAVQFGQMQEVYTGRCG